MCAKARLAASEFDKDKNISVRKSVAFPGSTLHVHDFYELEIIIGGKTETVLNGNKNIAERGAIFFMSPADFHEYSYSGTLDLYNIQFTSEAISSRILELAVNTGATKFTPSDSSFDEIFRLATVMHGIKDRDMCDDILTRLLESILLILTSECSSDTFVAHSTKTPDESIQRSLMYIHSHFKENPSLSDVSSTVHLNPRYFCTKFREYTGKTYKQYLKGIKLRYARRLIIATELPMIDIAENSGYSAQSHFNREFKEYYGISPLAIRKKHNEHNY